MAADEQAVREGRRTGLTTEQIKAAPHGAVFVWCNRHLDYPRRLARQLGRADLRIESPAFFDRGAWQGLNVDCVLDHHAPEGMTSPQWAAYHAFKLQFDARNS